MYLFSAATIEQAKQKIESSRWAEAGWRAVQQRVDAWQRQPGQIPHEAGGWIHNYVCAEHWLPLTYDANSPDLHACPAGHAFMGEKYDAAWRVWRHRQISDLAREAALAYVVLGLEAGRQTAISILTQYADFYTQFDAQADAESWMLQGHAFNQALTEALWAVPLIHAYDLTADSLDDSLRERLVRDLWQPLVAVMTRAQDKLIVQERTECNYMAWLNVTLGCLGFMLNDQALIDRAIRPPAGFEPRLSEAILADGFELECTPYYHNFVLLADLILAEAAMANNIDLYDLVGNEGQTLTGMGCALAQLTWPDGSIVDVAEGSYWQNSIYDPEICQVFELLYSKYPEQPIAWVLRSAYERQGAPRDNWAALLFGRNDVETAIVPAVRHTLLENSGFAVLRSEKKLAAMVPFGPFHKDHNQHDRLSMAVWPFSKDAGSPLYGLPTRRAWYPHSYAHNTLVMDGKSHANCGGELLEWNGRRLSVSAPDAYPGVSFTRTIEMKDDSIWDEFVVRSNETHAFDWVFHVDGEIEPLPDSQPLSQSLADDGPASFIELLAQKEINEGVTLNIDFDKESYLLTLQGDRSFTLIFGKGPGTSRNPQKKRHVLIGRTIGTGQRYLTTISQN